MSFEIKTSVRFSQEFYLYSDNDFVLLNLRKEVNELCLTVMLGILIICVFLLQIGVIYGANIVCLKRE